jgi:hypothetical protein
MAAEAFRDGRAVPALGWSGDPPLAEERVFPSFRLYARTIYEVAGLASVLTEAGQRVKTAAAEIETVRSIDRNLALLFWVIAALTLYKTTWWPRRSISLGPRRQAPMLIIGAMMRKLCTSPTVY